MKIEFTRNPAGINYAYFKGDQVDFPDALANEMIELGFAKLIHSKPTELPAEMPGRKVLIENGITTMDEVRKITDPETLMELKGIGKKVANQIIDFAKQ